MSYDILKGVRVCEVAAYWFVPSAGAMLADWGAEVIKVESSLRPEPMRGMRVGLDYVGPVGNELPSGRRNFMFEQSNRGKQAIAVDLSTEGGREIVYELAKKSDVFLTSFLTSARRKFHIDVDDIRRVNKEIIFAKGTGQGANGPDADQPGFDATSFWYRGGVGYLYAPSEDAVPPTMTVAFGDSIGGLALAAGISAALYRRATTGETSVIDVSLLGSAVWLVAPDTVASKLTGKHRIAMGTTQRSANPIAHNYRSKNGGLFRLSMHHAGHWADLLTKLGRADLAADERFKDTPTMEANCEFGVSQLEEIFANSTTEEMMSLLADVKGVWGVLQNPLAVHNDPQVIANDYIKYKTLEDGSEVELPMVATPVRFDDRAAELDQLAPLHGEHTDDVLRDVLGWDTEKIIELKLAGAVM